MGRENIHGCLFLDQKKSKVGAEAFQGQENGQVRVKRTLYAKSRRRGLYPEVVGHHWGGVGRAKPCHAASAPLAAPQSTRWSNVTSWEAVAKVQVRNNQDLEQWDGNSSGKKRMDSRDIWEGKYVEFGNNGENTDGEERGGRVQEGCPYFQFEWLVVRMEYGEWGHKILHTKSLTLLWRRYQATVLFLILVTMWI